MKVITINKLIIPSTLPATRIASADRGFALTGLAWLVLIPTRPNVPQEQDLALGIILVIAPTILSAKGDTAV